MGAFRLAGVHFKGLPHAFVSLQPGASKKEPVSSLEQVLKEVRGRRVPQGSPPPSLPASDSSLLLQTSREMVARSAATLITHPFHGTYPCSCL